MLIIKLIKWSITKNKSTGFIKKKLSDLWHYFSFVFLYEAETLVTVNNYTDSASNNPPQAQKQIKVIVGLGRYLKSFRVIFFLIKEAYFQELILLPGLLGRSAHM